MTTQPHSLIAADLGGSNGDGGDGGGHGSKTPVKFCGELNQIRSIAGYIPVIVCLPTGRFLREVSNADISTARRHSRAGRP